MTQRGLIVLVCVIALAAALRVAIGPAAAADGSVHLAFGVASGEILALRTNAALSAGLLGCVLGLSGLALQVLLRNPLASPFVLGISSGAGFGVALVLALAYTLSIPAMAFGGEVAGAVAGALATLAIVAWLGRAREGSDPTTLVLAGVIVGAIFSAGTMLLEQLVPHGLRGDLLSWMAGRLPEIPSRAAFWTLACAAAGGATTPPHAPSSSASAPRRPSARRSGTPAASIAAAHTDGERSRLRAPRGGACLHTCRPPAGVSLVP
jgi:iron complex transport system permease protein